MTAPDRGGRGDGPGPSRGRGDGPGPRSLVLTGDLCEGLEEGVWAARKLPPGTPQVPPHVPPLGNLQVPPPPGHPPGAAPAPWRPVPEDRGLPPPPFGSAHPGLGPPTLVLARSWQSQRPPPHSLWVSSPCFPAEHLRAGWGPSRLALALPPARGSGQSLALSLASPTNREPWRCGRSGPRETRPGLGGRAEAAGLLGTWTLPLARR